MAKKYYRVKEDTFMWDKGAVIESGHGCNDHDGYKEINDLYNHVELSSEYISAHIIENPANARFFKRVYPVNLVSKTVYKLKEEARDFFSKEHTA